MASTGTGESRPLNVWAPCAYTSGVSARMIVTAMITGRERTVCIGPPVFDDDRRVSGDGTAIIALAQHGDDSCPGEHRRHNLNPQFGSIAEEQGPKHRETSACDHTLPVNLLHQPP